MYTLMDELTASQRRESHEHWTRYRTVHAIAERSIATRPTVDGGIIATGEADCVQRVSRQLSMTRRQAEILIDETITLHENLPEVLDTLRDGITTRWQVQAIVSRTALVPADSSITPTLDAEIAATLRNKKGAWSRARLRDMVDRLVFRHDPDLVRERRKEALDNRGMFLHILDDGTGEITGVMSAENTRIAAKAVRALADSICTHDGRTVGQRNSDAMFALLTSTAFECHCDREDCTAQTPDPHTVVAAIRSQVHIHVVTDAATLAGAPGIGWIDGHGVISDEHVRDLAARPDATITPVTPIRTSPMGVVADTIANDSEGESSEGDALDTHTVKHARKQSDTSTTDDASVPSAELVIVYPGSLPSDPYRPTQACADFVRIRHGYCGDPFCDRSAFDSDLDHVAEYDHHNPARGGATSSENLAPKCRYGHLHKTFGDWIDVQYRDHDGRLVTEYITPEGYRIHGDAETLEDLFPNLRRIRFEQPAQAPPPPRVITGDNTPPPSNRTAAKHARRRAERARNQRERERCEAEDGPAPF
ncbi:13E12 repeat family protein [Gordonia rubripertincta]|uniref:13E12 repeat family protein n=1 Tax=Gordonia rubripertincta TaxID=36822 RepID=UPI0021B0D31E|nr:13E12 repeat family protein [Gordonia rubripertincta]